MGNISRYFSECCVSEQYKESQEAFKRWEKCVDAVMCECNNSELLRKTERDISYECGEDDFNLYKVTTIHYFTGLTDDTMVEYATKEKVELETENCEECGYEPPLEANVIVTRQDGTVDEYHFEGTLCNIDDDCIGNAFENPKTIVKVVIKDDIVSIGHTALSGCSNLEELIIGSGLTSIEVGGLEYCSKLNKITITASSAPRLDYYVFNGLPSSGTLTYPCESSYTNWLAKLGWDNTCN